MADNPNPGGYEGDQGPSDASGMTPSDATESTYDDWDRGQNGIAEGEREDFGKYLKGHADHVGVGVKEGVGVLVDTAAVLRNGNQDQKRQMLGHLIDNHDVRPEPTAEVAAQYDGASDTGGGQAFLNEEQAALGIQDFVAQNPIAADGEIQERMIAVAQDMRTQGFAPRLNVMFQHAIAQDPRYSEAARQASDADQVARARAANVQISGGANSTSAASQATDVGAILDELVPR